MKPPIILFVITLIGILSLISVVFNNIELEKNQTLLQHNSELLQHNSELLQKLLGRPDRK